MLRLPERRLQSWERHGLVRRRERYAIPDLIVLRTLAELRRKGVSATRLRRAVAALQEMLGPAPDPLKEFRVYAEGKRVVVRSGSGSMEPASGQLLLDFDAGNWAKTIAFHSASGAQGELAAEQARHLEAALWFERGLELEQRGAPLEEVTAAYERAVELDQASAGALVNLGTICFHARDWKRAQEYYRRAIEAAPDYPLAHFNLGNLYDEQGDRTQALLHYLAALRLDPDYADAHYNLALLYQAGGQVMRALRHWRAYLKLDPSSSWAAVARQELEKLRRATVIEGSGAGVRQRDAGVTA